MDLHGSHPSHSTFMSGMQSSGLVEPGILTEYSGQSSQVIARVLLLYVPDGHFSHAVPEFKS